MTDIITAKDGLKFCTNCKHIATNASLEYAFYKCMSPKNPHTINLITGLNIYNSSYCDHHRKAEPTNINTDKFCTAAGNWYEPKEMLPAKIIVTTPPKHTISRNLADNLGM